MNRTTLRRAGSVLALSAVLCGAALAAATGTPQTSRDEVEKFARGYIEASGGGDPAIIMEMVSKRPEASSVGMGNINRGWEQIRSETVKLAGTQGTHRITPGRMDVT